MPPRGVNTDDQPMAGNGPRKRAKAVSLGDDSIPYRLDEQVGYLLRRATQRHLGIFGGNLPDMTPPQFAALAKLFEMGAMSQNELGRHTAMDGATIKGVIDRLREKGLVESRADAVDRRRMVIALSDQGRDLYAASIEAARRITRQTLAPLSAAERERFLELLAKIT